VAHKLYQVGAEGSPTPPQRQPRAARVNFEGVDGRANTSAKTLLPLAMSTPPKRLSSHVLQFHV